MAYQSGNATNVVDLLNQLRNFLAGLGYNIEMNSSEGSGLRVTLSRGGRFFNFRALINETIPGQATHTGLFMNASTSLNSSNAWYDQLNAFTYTQSSTVKWVIAGMTNILSVNQYYFHAFSTSDYDVVYVTVESPAGVYQRLFFGKISTEKYGNWANTGTKGMFFHGSVGAHYTGASNSLSVFGSSGVWGQQQPYGGVWDGSVWLCGTHDINPSFFTTARPYLADGFSKKTTIFNNAPNSFNGLPVLLPIDIYKGVSNGQIGDDSPIIPIGELPNLYFVNIKNIVPGNFITFGSDSYVAYPFYKKSDTWNQSDATNGTYYLGYAVKG